MILKKSPFAIQNKNQRDLDNVNDSSDVSDIIIERNISSSESNTVHHRRDLDSLG